jgi:hypothetical protein
LVALFVQVGLSKNTDLLFILDKQNDRHTSNPVLIQIMRSRAVCSV